MISETTSLTAGADATGAPVIPLPANQSGSALPPIGSSPLEAKLAEAEDAQVISKLITDANEDVALIASAVSAYKSRGVMGLLPLISRAHADAAKTAADVEQAIPAVKSGFKTSEFWFAVVSVIAPSVGAAVGHPAPTGVALGGIGIAALYAGLRSLVKASR